MAGDGHRSGVVALVGRPNVGKSTLLNRLVGAKISIVSDKPQTTRNRITGVVRRPGAQIAVIDAPGLHRPLFEMNRRMMRMALGALDGVDLMLVMTDVTEPFGGGDAYLVELIGRRPEPALLVVNKIDAVRKPAILPVIDRWSKAGSFGDVYPISARNGEGVDVLLDGIVGRLPPGPELFPEGQDSDVSTRFMAAELVREKLLERTHAELPHTSTVVVESFEDEEGGDLRIACRILVERPSQKGIVIGRGGGMIKAIGAGARRELEQSLGRRVHLTLDVAVRRRWRQDARLLDRLGLVET